MYTESDSALRRLYEEAQLGQFTYQHLRRRSNDELAFLAGHDPAVETFLIGFDEKSVAEQLDLLTRKNKLENNARRARLVLEVRLADKRSDDQITTLITTTEHAKNATLQAAAYSAKELEDSTARWVEALETTTSQSTDVLKITAKQARRATWLTAFVAAAAILAASFISWALARPAVKVIRLPSTPTSTTRATRPTPTTTATSVRPSTPTT